MRPTPAALSAARDAAWPGWLAVASAPVAAACNVLTLAAVRFDPAGIADPRVLLGSGPHGAALVRWAMLADLVGYYLLVAPLFAHLARRWRGRADVGQALGAAGLAYTFVGAIGATILATALPPIVTAWAADPTQRAALAPLFDALMQAVSGGLWNLLEAALGGVAWLGFGVALRAERPRWAALTIVLGAATLLDACATMLGASDVAGLALAVYLLLAPVWALWTGVAVVRDARRAAVPNVGPGLAPGATPLRRVAVR